MDWNDSTKLRKRYLADERGTQKREFVTRKRPKLAGFQRASIKEKRAFPHFGQ